MSPRARAAVMSLLLPGLGQMYLGKAGRAAIWFAGLVAIYLITGQRDGDRWIAPVFATVLGIAAAIDAMVSGRGAGQRL
jgi:TM2 domain-containing membrane protein YozV